MKDMEVKKRYWKGLEELKETPSFFTEERLRVSV